MVLAAELFAIWKALIWISNNLHPSKIVLCVDSTAAFLSLKGQRPDYSILAFEYLWTTKVLIDRGHEITFQCTPTHCGIIGKERADIAAKEALKLPNICTDKPFLGDFNVLLKKIFNTHLMF